jgi:hypothetical protein
VHRLEQRPSLALPQLTPSGEVEVQVLGLSLGLVEPAQDGERIAGVLLLAFERIEEASPACAQQPTSVTRPAWKMAS